jgi:hypothetical protein
MVLEGGNQLLIELGAEFDIVELEPLRQLQQLRVVG